MMQKGMNAIRSDTYPPYGYFVEVGDEEQDICQQHPQCNDTLEDGPPDEEYPEDHDAGDRHGTADRKTIRMGEVVGGPEYDNDEDDGNEEHPVDDIDVDLGAEMGGGVFDMQQGHDMGCDPLVDDGEYAGDHGLRCDDGGSDAHDEERDIQEPELGEYHLEEDILAPGMHHDECPLPEIIDGKSDKYEIPGMDDRLTAEVAHVGIQGFPAGCTEDDRGEDEKTCQPVVEQVTDTEQGVECKEDLRGGEEGDQAVPASATNHRTMTGPNAHATRSEPRACSAKRPTAMTAAMVMRTIWVVFSNPGMRRIPSTAERMLIAGVMTPSPIKREIPTIASRDTKATWFPDFSRGRRISLSTIVPPSPFLPRCIARYVYSIVTRMVSVQMIRERMPMILSGVGGMRRKIAVRV